MSSTDHLAILPVASLFWIISPKGKDETRDGVAEEIVLQLASGEDYGVY